jgi:hypothetical protein
MYVIHGVLLHLNDVAFRARLLRLEFFYGFKGNKNRLTATGYHPCLVYDTIPFDNANLTCIYPCMRASGGTWDSGQLRLSEPVFGRDGHDERAIRLRITLYEYMVFVWTANGLV